MKSFKEWKSLNERNDAYQMVDGYIDKLLGQTQAGSQQERSAFGGAVGALRVTMSELFYEFIEIKTMLEKAQIQNPEFSQAIANMDKMIEKIQKGP